MPNLLVVGSINMDIVTRVERHPRPGETVRGLGTTYNNGGKGANQAVAAARAGGSVTMVGAVGQDAFAASLLQGLEQSGVNPVGVGAKADTSGLALIAVNESGENNIILASGANAHVTPADVDRVLDGDTLFEAVLVQNEIPWETTVHALTRAAKRNIRTIFNPAPARTVDRDVLALVDTLVLNESEAETISGVSVVDVDSARRAARLLLDRGVTTVLITLGAKGSVRLTKAGDTLVTPAQNVQAVDTTAAGDTFVGAYAVAICEGQAATNALQFATAAAAIAVTRSGAQPSIPHRNEILARLGEFHNDGRMG